MTVQPGGSRFKGAKQYQTAFTDLDSVHRFQSELITEHLTAESQLEQVTPEPGRRQMKTDDREVIGLARILVARLMLLETPEALLL